ncbi:MAG TPA: alpha/beta hydrolase [Bacteroidales bacterium]|nr:alpha/beta hydrolase [Bacteroidales bacterium]
MEKQTAFNRKKIHYTRSGQGETLILLHGFLESKQMWKEHQKVLAEKYQVVAIDLPGHGKSEQISAVHSMSLMAGTVKAVMDAEKIQSCVMIGHSMGGYVTLAFARNYPELLKGFGLFHSQAMADDETAKKNRERSIEIILQDKGSYINQFIPSLFAPKNRDILQKQIQNQIEMANAMSKENVIAAMTGMKERESSLDILIDTNVPVLFILGKQDSRIPLEKVLAQTALPTISQTLILGEAGHMSWMEETNKTIQAMDGFMSLCLSE